MCLSIFRYGLCNPATYCLVEVSASQSSRKCSMSSVVFALHISQFVYPSVCLLSTLCMTHTQVDHLSPCTQVPGYSFSSHQEYSLL